MNRATSAAASRPSARRTPEESAGIEGQCLVTPECSVMSPEVAAKGRSRRTTMAPVDSNTTALGGRSGVAINAQRM